MVRSRRRVDANSMLRALDTLATKTAGLVTAVAALGSLLSGLGLIVAAAQFYETRKAGDATAYAQIAQIWHNHMGIFVEHPQIRRYFFGGAPQVIDVSDQQLVAAVADMRLDAMDRVITAARLNGWENRDLASWTQTFTRAFRQAPVLCGTYESVASDYPSLAVIAKDGCAGEPDSKRRS